MIRFILPIALSAPLFLAAGPTTPPVAATRFWAAKW